MMQEHHVDRRAFGRGLAAGVLAVMPLTADARAECADEPKAEPTGNRPTPAELILQLVKLQYPERLDEERLAAIRQDIEGFLNRSRLLSGFPLVNADEPAFEFAAYRKQEG